MEKFDAGDKIKQRQQTDSGKNRKVEGRQCGGIKRTAGKADKICQCLALKMDCRGNCLLRRGKNL